MVETHKRERKNTVITKITLTISNAKHIKQILSTNKPYRHQQHLPKISQNVSSCTDGNSIWKKYLHCSITAMLNCDWLWVAQCIIGNKVWEIH